MLAKKLRINNKKFITYKFFNSLFAGISAGITFNIFSSLDPSIASISGIALTICTLFVATLYSKILNINYFYKISLFVELIILCVVTGFLLFSFNYQIVLFIYIGYQISFIFGDYLWRAETLMLKKDKILTLVDIFKKTGYLVGLAIALLFYKLLEYKFQIIDNQTKVFFVHYLLLLVQILIIYFLIKSFEKFKHY
tara:strand:+ start:215 stop:802 length:588 start_codon:yes stop_codon:yes gene_type:complete